ncbi:MAG: nucleoside recognition protein [Deltaproteobacteria bacterium SG8_13]|nr:MAG: nucleoside recognition protein [Deltaproteobacteria bacterium SG8_13]
MLRKKAKPNIRAAAVSLLVSAVALGLGAVFIEGLQLQDLARKLFWPLLRLMGFICVGLAVGQVIEASGWTRTIAAVGMPAFRFANLGSRCSAAFTTAFFSGVAANAMLLDFYREKKITRPQLFLSNFINQLPGFFLHLPTTFFIVVPLTRGAGILYFLLTFSAALLRTAVFLLYGHLRLPADGSKKEELSDRTGKAEEKTARRDQAWQGIRSRLPTRLANIAIYVVPIYITVFIFNRLGMFNLVRTWLAGYITTSFIPVESLSVVVMSFAAEFTSGFAAAGAMLDAGVLTVKQTVVALLIGNITAFPIRALRHQLPHYMGIFSPRMGTQLLVMGQSFRVLSIMIVGGLYLAFA